MQNSILTEITKENLGAYLSKSEYLNNFVFPKFFTWKPAISTDFSVIIAQSGNTIAGDICALDSSSPEKRRKIVSRLTGEIPPIKLHRKMSERQIKDYYALKAIGASMNDILSLVYDDVDFVMNGALARLEWLALQAISRFKLELTISNNAGIITQAAIDFGLPDTHKEVEAAAGNYWTIGAKATNTPISDIETVCSEARTAGIRIKYVLMNRSKWAAFSVSTEVSNAVYALLVSGGITQPGFAVTVEQVNNFMINRGLPEILIVDSVVDIETAEHAVTGTDCWLDTAGADRYVTFVPDLPVGSILFTSSPEELTQPKQVIQQKKNNVLVSKWSTVDPTVEYTKGEILAFPIIERIQECFSLDTENTVYGS